MQIVRLGALALTVSLFACGDDGGGPRLIDSGIGNTDAPPKVCTAVAALGSMEADVTDEELGRYIRYYADAGDINGDPLYVYMTFRRSMTVTTIPPTVDVTADPANLDFYTCTTCVYALQFDPMTFEVKKIFFQQSGSITFDVEPITMRRLTADFSALRLQEIEFDQQSGEMSYVPTGDCASITASIDQDNIPNDWTCDPALYYTGIANPASSCDCNCGYYDGDCRNAAAATAGCSDSALPRCWPDDTVGSTCVAAVANDTCATAAGPLTTPTTGNPSSVSGNSVGAQRDYNAGLNAMTCTKYRQPGPDVVHSIALVAGVTYNFKLTGLATNIDMSLSLVGPGTSALCTDNITTCVAGDDEGFDGADEEFAYTVPTGGTGTYFIIVDSFERDDAGPYTIEVSVP